MRKLTKSFYSALLPVFLLVVAAGWATSLRLCAYISLLCAFSLLLFPLAAAAALVIFCIIAFGSSLGTPTFLQWRPDRHILPIEIVILIAITFVLHFSGPYYRVLSRIQYPQLWGAIVGFFAGGLVCLMLYLGEILELDSIETDTSTHFLSPKSNK